MWIEINPRDTENVEVLRELLGSTGDDRLTIIADDPGYEVYDPYYVDHDWGFTITGETIAGEKTLFNDYERITLYLSTEKLEYCEVNYSSWVALAELSKKFTITGKDVVIEDDGSVNLTETMLRVTNRC
jgi:hypothetical protein